MRDFELINENLRHALGAFVRVRPHGQLMSLPGLSLVYAGVPYNLFNTALITSPLPSAEGGFFDQMDRAADFFARQNAPWSVWFCDDMLAVDERRKARVALATRGLRLTMEAPGMISGSLIAPSRRLPAKLHFEQVGDSRTREHFSQVMSSAFHVPHEMSRDVYCGEALWTGGMKGWIGYLNDEPVTTTAVMVNDDSIGLYAVATQPRHQRQGYAEAIMRHAIASECAGGGPSRSILQSSAVGYPLYVRMGYRAVTRFFVYVK